jgi:hypothetical protein
MKSAQFACLCPSTATVTFDDQSSSRPLTSSGFSISGGIEIDLASPRCREGHTTPRRQLGANITYIFGRADSVDSSGDAATGVTQHVAFGLVAGIEFPLGLPP